MSDAPTAPDRHYLDGLRAATAAAAERAVPIESAYVGAPAALAESVGARLRGHTTELSTIAHELHAHPEQAFAERRAVNVLTDLLREQGFEVDVGIGGLETAFVASAGVGASAGTTHPHVAILAEYDALPGIGHGCGHNVIAAAGLGGFLGAATAVTTTGGRVSLIGTPGEEGHGGKEYLARAGVFDDVDAVVMTHPFGGYDIATQPFLGRRQLAITFHGVAAHASAQPFMGVNALDAAVTAYQGVAALRQHLPPDDRVHGIVTEGGERPNVVPERAALLFYLRSAEPETLRTLATRLERIARGAAEMHGCGITLEWDPHPAYLPIRHNRTLAARWAVHQATRGRKALPAGVVPEFLTGSSDLGNLSVRLPAIHPMIAIGDPGIAMHTREFAEAAGGSSAASAVLDGAYGLAMTALDFLADHELRDAVTAEFRAAGGVLDVPGYFE